LSGDPSKRSATIMTPTVVLIPGLMNDAWVWREQATILSRRGPVLIACNDDADSLSQMAARIEAATAGSLFVAGHSMGGRVALELAARAPERVARLALLSTGAHGPRDDEAAGRMRLVALARSSGMDAVADAWLPAMVAPDTPDTLRASIRAMLCRASRETFAAQQMALLERSDRSDLLPGLPCPTLIATGEFDGWSSPERHRRMADAVPDSRLEIVSGAGHMLPVEAPATVSALLEAFFYPTG
jgi:pimeloyl-ACP methyl ester carboxylesterase